MPTYPNLDIKNQPQFIQTMVDSTTVEDVIAAFQRIVPLDKSVRKPRGGAEREAETGSWDMRSRKRSASSSRASRSVPVEADDEELSSDDEDQYAADEDCDRSPEREDVDARPMDIVAYSVPATSETGHFDSGLVASRAPISQAIVTSGARGRSMPSIKRGASSSRASRAVPAESSSDTSRSDEEDQDGSGDDSESSEAREDAEARPKNMVPLSVPATAKGGICTSKNVEKRHTIGQEVETSSRRARSPNPHFTARAMCPFDSITAPNFHGEDDPYSVGNAGDVGDQYKVVRRDDGPSATLADVSDDRLTISHILAGGARPRDSNPDREARVRELEEMRVRDVERIHAEVDIKYAASIQSDIPPVRRTRTPLWILMKNGLLSEEERQRISSEDHLLQMMQEVVAEGQMRFTSAIGMAFCTQAISTEELNACKPIVELAQFPWSEKLRNRWVEVVRPTWLFLRREKEAEEWEVSGRARAARLQEDREAELNSRIASYDKERSVEWEALVWDYNLLFHFYADNPLIRELLPPMPWRHNSEEARVVLSILKAASIDPMIPPREARLLKCWFIANGFSNRFVPPLLSSSLLPATLGLQCYRFRVIGSEFIFF